MLYILKY